MRNRLAHRDPCRGRSTGQVDLTDAWLIAVWLNDPSDPALPSGIGEPGGPAASLSPDPSTVTFADDGAWHRFTVAASVSDNRLTPGQTFELSATVRNRGIEQAAPTTLRYYRSDDATIDATDTPVGTSAVKGGDDPESF